MNQPCSNLQPLSLIGTTLYTPGLRQGVWQLKHVTTLLVCEGKV